MIIMYHIVDDPPQPSKSLIHLTANYTEWEVYIKQTTIELAQKFV